jgi:hypothetical protein
MNQMKMPKPSYLPSSHRPPLEKLAEGVYRSGHFIDDEDVPPGYHKKRTPFGDFLIKDEEIPSLKGE